MTFTVRPATDEDKELLAPINSSAKATLRSHYERIKTYVPPADSPTTLVVAETDGRLVGRCEYRINNQELYFLSLGILAAFRNQGALRRIFEFLESVAKQKGCSGITCETIEETGNRKIFEKLGMIVSSRVQSEKYVSPSGQPVHEILMFKEIV